MSYDPFSVPDDLKSPDAVPTSETNDAPASKPLHSLSGVVVATFLGTPIAGSIVIALSLWRLGRKTAARFVVGGIVLVTSCFFAALFFLPENHPAGRAYLIPQLVIMYMLRKQS